MNFLIVGTLIKVVFNKNEFPSTTVKNAIGEQTDTFLNKFHWQADTIWTRLKTRQILDIDDGDDRFTFQFENVDLLFDLSVEELSVFKKELHEGLFCRVPQKYYYETDVCFNTNIHFLTDQEYSILLKQTRHTHHYIFNKFDEKAQELCLFLNVKLHEITILN
jgi:hypothetical protein